MKLKLLKSSVVAIATLTTIPLTTIGLSSCSNDGSTSKYSITYSSTSAGLTFVSKPTSVEKNKEVIISYSISNGYEIDTINSKITIGSTDVTSSCSITATQLTIPANLVIGNIIVNLKTETAVTADYSITYSSTPDGLSWTTKPASASKNKSVTISYSLSSGYSIDLTKSKISISGKDVTTQIGTYNSGSITIPASLVAGNILIALETKHATTYTVSYGSKPQGLTWVKNPAVATDNAMFSATYTLDGYVINTAESSITINDIEQKENLTYANGTIVIPANMVTGKIVISLITKVEESTGDVTSTDHTASISTAKGTSVGSVYTITPNTAANAGEVNVTLNGILLSTQILIDDSKATKAYTYNITLDDCSISNAVSTEKKSEQPFLIKKNDNYKSTFNIILKDGSENAFNDRRTGTLDSSFSNDVCFQSKSLGDINIKGNGSLSINNVNGYKGCLVGKGIQTKGNLTISENATVNVFAYDTAIQVGGALTINSAYVGADSYYDDAIKTKFEDAVDDLPLAGTGNIKRDISIKGTSIVKVYAARTGINSAHNIVVSGTPTIDVATTKTYANADGTNRVNPSDVLDEQNMYIAVPSSAINYDDIEKYYYGISFYDSSKSAYLDPEIMTLKKIRKDNQYYFFKADRPLDSNISKFKILKYKIDQFGQSSQSAIATSGELTISSPSTTNTKDCVTIKSVSESTISTTSTTFDTNYNTLKEGGGGMPASIDNTISSKGFKAKNDINISSGTITIQSGDTCINASYGDIYCNSLTSGDVTFGSGNINVSGGTITATSNQADGIKAYGTMNVTGGETTVTKSVEALEAGCLNIAGGVTKLSASDDGLNASQTGKYNTSMVSINMSGGILDVQTTSTNDTDAVDSNNTISIKGGLLIARVPGQSPSSSLDWESGSIEISNATIILMGLFEKSKSISGGAPYETTSSIYTSGTHTITYYTSSEKTLTYTFNNNQKMNTNITIRSNFDQPTFN